MSKSTILNRRQFLQGSVIGGASLALPVAHAAPNDRITVGFIGVGSRAVGLMRDSQATGQCEITTVCDAYSGRVTAARELLARPEIDAVVIATPDHWHVRMVEDALAAGKHVYVEKPMTYTVAEGNIIRAAVEKSGKILQVGSQGVSSTVEAEARSIIQSGRLGQITLLRANYNRNSASGAWIYPIPPDASEKTVNWEMFLGPAPKQPFSLERFFRWRCYWDYSGGIATDLFVHLCTTVHFLMDATMPETVSARGSMLVWAEASE